jgi:hypothetical protein
LNLSGAKFLESALDLLLPRDLYVFGRFDLQLRNVQKNAGELKSIIRGKLHCIACDFRQRLWHDPAVWRSQTPVSTATHN